MAQFSGGRSWLPNHLLPFHGVINFSSKAVDLPVSRDKVILNPKRLNKVEEISDKSIVLIEKLIDGTQSGTDIDKDNCAIAVAFSYQEADEHVQSKILKRLDIMNISSLGKKRTTPLHKLIEIKPPAVYFEYAGGNTVDKLTIVDQKQLYHMPSDLVQLQAHVLKEQGKLVIECSRLDKDNVNVNESEILTDYFKSKNIHTIDLTERNVIQGSLRSRPIPRMIRQEINSSIKFVEVRQLRTKRAWKVGAETWINTSHPQMADLYDKLQGNMPKSKILLLRALLLLLTYDYETGINELCDIIC